MELSKQISAAWFHANFKRTGKNHNAIFGGKRELMDAIFSTGIPIYVDESYYVQRQTLQRVEKYGDHYHTCERTHLEEWRDCHYYVLYEAADGTQAWLLTGGRYD